MVHAIRCQSYLDSGRNKGNLAMGSQKDELETTVLIDFGKKPKDDVKPDISDAPKETRR